MKRAGVEFDARHTFHRDQLMIKSAGLSGDGAFASPVYKKMLFDWTIELVYIVIQGLRIQITD
jgi:hypothetical protein